jgi:hypothetical protein
MLASLLITSLWTLRLGTSAPSAIATVFVFKDIACKSLVVMNETRPVVASFPIALRRGTLTTAAATGPSRVNINFRHTSRLNYGTVIFITDSACAPQEAKLISFLSGAHCLSLANVLPSHRVLRCPRAEAIAALLRPQRHFFGPKKQ